LRMLVADELRQLSGVRVTRESETLRTPRGSHALDHFLGFLLAQRADEHFAGVVRTTGGDELARDCHVVALFEDLALDLFGHLFELEDLKGERLDLRLPEVLQHFGGNVWAERDQQCGRLLATFQCFRAYELSHGQFLRSSSIQVWMSCATVAGL